MKKTPLLVIMTLAVISCSTQMRLGSLRRGQQDISLILSENDFLPDLTGNIADRHMDTLTVKDDEGHDIIIMKAIRDENGDMVANEVIDAAIVTAKFKNIAERHGKVDLRFMVKVPASMLYSRWQLRLVPEMNVLEDRVKLEPVIITGKDYRKAQLRGYQQYERFINSIITDTTRFLREHELEVFIRRNLPEIYKLKTDSTYVSDEQFASVYGVTERQAVEHYTNQLASAWNKRKTDRKDKMFDKYVKVPIVTEGLRLDTVLTSIDGDFIYEYIQTINTVPALKKVDISLSGGIFEEDRNMYSIPSGPPITFYISSLSSLCTDEEHFLTRIIERKVVANTTCWIDFEQGKADIRPELGNNSEEIASIKENLLNLLDNKEFDIDSIIVTASCSPEGRYGSNDMLSQKRSKSVSDYLDRFISHSRDSIIRERGVFMDLDMASSATEAETGHILFLSRNIPEDWNRLYDLIGKDESLKGDEKAHIFSLSSMSDLDSREKALSRESYYPYLRDNIYPLLRAVKFDFHLHRKGMVKDTLHTTVLDTTYMKGVQAIKDRDYKTAVSLLRPYGDYNAAVAYCCLDYNESAISILEGLDRDAPVNYLLAILYSRKEMTRDAVQCYLAACRLDPSYIHRGNLDPEISALIKLYDLNKEEQDYPEQ